jgi:hypothetical protein
MRAALPCFALITLTLAGCGLAETAATGAAGAAGEAQQAAQARQTEERLQQQAEAAVQLDAQRRAEAEKQGQ